MQGATTYQLSNTGNHQAVVELHSTAIEMPFMWSFKPQMSLDI